MNNSLWNGLILITAIASVIAFYFLYTQTQTAQKDAHEDYLKAEQTLDSPQPLEAMKIINNYQPTAFPTADSQQDWLNLKIRALSQIPDQGSKLADIYQNNPQALDNNEKAAQIVGGMLLKQGNKDAYHQLKNKWIAKSDHPKGWFVLDAYEKMQDGKPDDAVTFLHSGSFSGPADPIADQLIDALLSNSSDSPKMKESLLKIRQELSNQK